MRDDLEKQLHEQYAINNNETATALITLLVALSASLGAYGYVFVHSHISFCTTPSFTSNAVAFTAAVVIGTLYVMAWLCYELGTSRRLDQFIVYAIRRNAYGETFNVHQHQSPEVRGENNKGEGDIFPKGYHPFGKKNNFCIGIFGTLLKIINCIFVAIVLLTICRLANGDILDVCSKLRMPRAYSEWLFIVAAIGYFVSVIIGQLIIIIKENCKCKWWNMIKKMFCSIRSVLFLGLSFQGKYHTREEEFKAFEPKKR